MDIARPEAKKKKKIRRIVYIAAAVVLIPLVTYALSKLKPAAPTVDSATVWTDTVNAGRCCARFAAWAPSSRNDSADPRRHRRPSGEALSASGHAGESRHRHPGYEQSRVAAELRSMPNTR